MATGARSLAPPAMRGSRLEDTSDPLVRLVRNDKGTTYLVATVCVFTKTQSFARFYKGKNNFASNCPPPQGGPQKIPRRDMEKYSCLYETSQI